ncbi:hypothetical protein [Desulfovibrio inopinatus]|uniref:hypothetical protein n=1 Tax=Desulfovibrio inopinatus TaxID=102109 RepID=UPI000420356D|nr:hypothetical protein [Desulfovibrio inopinatus]
MDPTLEWLNTTLDPFLIAPFRLALEWTGQSMPSFLFGLTVLAAVATLMGEISMGIVYLLNRKHYRTINEEMISHHNLSIQAIAQKDKQSYKACNRVANEAFGLSFFSKAALFAASLWPVPVAMGWLSYRFDDIGFALPFSVPYVGSEVGFAAFFIPLYVVIRIGFALMKKRLPLFRSLEEFIRKNEEPSEPVMSWSDLGVKAPSTPSEPSSPASHSPSQS